MLSRWLDQVLKVEKYEQILSFSLAIPGAMMLLIKGSLYLTPKIWFRETESLSNKSSFIKLNFQRFVANPGAAYAAHQVLLT